MKIEKLFPKTRTNLFKYLHLSRQPSKKTRCKKLPSSPKKVSRRACKRYLGRGCKQHGDKGRERGRGQEVAGMCIHRERWSYGGSYRRVITLIAAIKWQQHPRGVATAPRRLFSLHTHTHSCTLWRTKRREGTYAAYGPTLVTSWNIIPVSFDPPPLIAWKDYEIPRHG